MEKVATAGAQGSTEAPAATTTIVEGVGKTPEAAKAAEAAKPTTEEGAGKPGEEKPATEGAKPNASDDGKGGKEGAPTEQPKAPDTYTLAIPTGAEAFLDASDLQTFEVKARKAGLTNEQAQQALEEHADEMAALSATYRAETVADPTYGGEHLAETQQLAQRGLDYIAPKGTPHGDALRRDLTRSGFGNKLSVVAALVRLGKERAEDKPALTPSGGAKPERDAASVLYGSPS
jgi:hypothetical protein